LPGIALVVGDVVDGVVVVDNFGGIDVRSQCRNGGCNQKKEKKKCNK
jgi:hypothetical protein